VSALYTLGVWIEHPDGSRTHEVVNDDWRLPFDMADTKAAALNGTIPGRTYHALNVNDIQGVA